MCRLPSRVCHIKVTASSSSSSWVVMLVSILFRLSYSVLSTTFSKFENPFDQPGAAVFARISQTDTVGLTADP